MPDDAKRNPAFSNTNPIADRFATEARESVEALMGDFSARIDEMLGGLDLQHASWQTKLVEDAKLPPRIVMPRGYYPTKP